MSPTTLLSLAFLLCVAAVIAALQDVKSHPERLCRPLNPTPMRILRERHAMLNLEAILAKTEEKYLEKRPDREGLQSEQVRALAAVLVEAINEELAAIGLPDSTL